MSSDDISVFLSVLCLVLVAHSWYVHYRVKDGLARLMLLWGCGFIFIFLLFRVINIMLLRYEVLDLGSSRDLAFYNVYFIYAIVIGQWWIQRRGAERKEDNLLQDDKKELKARRKKD